MNVENIKLNKNVIAYIKKLITKGYSSTNIAAYLLVNVCPRDLPREANVNNLKEVIDKIKNNE